jgi:DNA helicase-2/ATP-dependent DNA helicase PcrA
LKERGIAVQVLGGTQFYDRKEVKDLLAYLRVALNPRDEIALRRVLNYPSRQIGEAALEKIENAANVAQKGLFDIVQDVSALGLATGAAEGCQAFASTIERARSALSKGAAAAAVARSIVEDVRLREDIFDGSASNAQAARRWGNVEALMRVFERHDARMGSASAAELGNLIRLLMLSSDDDERAGERAVTMTTMHGAKGLEYQVVFIVGLEEGLVPHARTLDQRATDVGGSWSNDLEEERRLLYVSITRAKDKLYLCRAKRRVMRGKMAPRTPSRFLADIGAELVEERTVAGAAAPATATAAARGAALLAALDGAGPVLRASRK